jgi:minor extracellular serine protease Vpr
VSAQSPAQVGEIVLVFLTGLGATDPPTADGAPGPTNPFSQIVGYLQVLVDGQVAPLNFAGLAPGFAGLYQINIQIPAGVRAGDDYVDISTPSAYHSQATIAIQ